MNRTIFKQLFFYFVTPIILPIIISIPATLSVASIFTIAVTWEEILRNMLIVFGMLILVYGEILRNMLIVFGMLILVYGIYFIATDVQFNRNINETR